MNNTAGRNLEAIFRAAILACHPDQIVPRFLPSRPSGPCLILAAGKAAAGMARALEQCWGPPLSGLVVTRHLFGIDLDYLPVATAGHPLPDTHGARAADRMLALASACSPQTDVIVLLSGGASALLSSPAPGNTLDSKITITRSLLASGAPIHEINCVRRHLSRIKGGRLAAACTGSILTLAISDVVGDSPFAIGSGPTLCDPTTVGDAQAILSRYGISDQGLKWDETVKPGDPRLDRSRFQIIARAHDLIDAAAAKARELGFEPIILGYEIEGEASVIGASHARQALAARARGHRCALISGGELTVALNVGNSRYGQGGPNQEYALSLALALDGAPEISALAADSDGVDGSNNAAGAIVLPDILTRARNLNLDLATMLENHDSGGAFQKLNNLFQPGPTQTNVNDLRVILINPTGAN